jgi:hypothetical protein
MPKINLKGEKMKRKILTTTVILSVILLMSSVMLMAMPVNAEDLPLQPSGSQPLPSGVTPDVIVKTKVAMSFRPNPVGLNQPFLVNIWLVPPTHVSRYLTGYKVTIVKPNGDQEVITMDSYCGDATAWFEYIADQVGTWKLKFEFPGGYFPPGIYQAQGMWVKGNFTFTESCYYEPASTDWQELVVKEDYVAQSWPPSPLPTDYWTRPAYQQNREWWWILGSYPWHGPGGGSNWPANTNPYWSPNYHFLPWREAPETAHIVWKRQEAIKGLIGPFTSEQKKPESFISISAIGGPSVIFQGRCYQSVTLPGGTSALRCYDLRTGEVYWEVSPDPVPSSTFFGFTSRSSVQLEYSSGGSEVPGAQPEYGQTVYLVTIGNGRLIKIDPWSGAIALNVSISPLTSGTYYRNGYALGVQSTNPYWPYFGPPPQNFLINWTTLGSATSLKDRVVNNITWPWTSEPGGFGSVVDFQAGIAAQVSAINNPATGAEYGTYLEAVSLKTGKQLWNKTLEDETAYPSMVADHGKVAFLTMNGYFLAYNLADGTLAWKSETLDYPWDATGFGAYFAGSAYGLLYRNAYSGMYALNWTNGKIVWKFEAPAPYPYETPYTGRNGTTVYPFDGEFIIADGKIYVFNTEHTPTQPITRGWRLFCLNATTGKNIWNITLCADVPGPNPFYGAIADGYLIEANELDGYLYCFGKGKSATTITGPETAVPLGSTVLIKGTVLDQSPAQPGTPCVAKESMTAWMEYLHMQGPYPSEVKGVPVTLTAIKSDGKVIDLGTVTTNGFYGTFGFAWTPEEEGTYTIIACFMGDDSYGSSAAATAITVGPAPPEPETPEYPTPTDYTPMFAGLAIAVLIAIIIGVANLYTLRKRK